LMGRAAETELMPRLVGGDTEIVCGKLKDPKRFLKPNFEPGPKLRQAGHKIGAQHYRDLRISAFTE
jgi:hypothetical protein